MSQQGMSKQREYAEEGRGPSSHCIPAGRSGEGRPQGKGLRTENRARWQVHPQLRLSDVLIKYKLISKIHYQTETLLQIQHCAVPTKHSPEWKSHFLISSPFGSLLCCTNWVFAGSLEGPGFMLEQRVMGMRTVLWERGLYSGTMSFQVVWTFHIYNGFSGWNRPLALKNIFYLVSW